MNLSVAELKRLSLTHSYLLSASRYLEEKGSLGFPSSQISLAEVEDQLSEEALVRGLNAMSELGKSKSPRAAFWKDLSSAAEAIGQLVLATELHDRFLLTLETTNKHQH